MTFKKGTRIIVAGSDFTGTVTEAPTSKNDHQALVQIDDGMEIQVAEENLRPE